MALEIREALKSVMFQKKLNRLSFSQTPPPLAKNLIVFVGIPSFSIFFFNMNVTSCPYIYPSIYVYLRISNGCWSLKYTRTDALLHNWPLPPDFSYMYPCIINCETIAEGYISIKNIQHFHWLLHSDASILWRGFICRFYDKLNLECWSLNPLPPKLNRLSFFWNIALLRASLSI